MQLGFSSGNLISYNMNRKLFYVAPETELILVRFEENILSGMDTQGVDPGNYNGMNPDEQEW